ncbi:hypothetical protein FMN50_13700 [Rhodobacterales bacterium]|nr:hypothetical protein FMN50_13700 [Rhodobacterales bacterium]
MFCADANGRVIAAARLSVSESSDTKDCPTYMSALEYALAAAPPPYDTREYDDLFRISSEDATWMAVSLITNAEREGDGAKRLWSLAACSRHDTEQHLLKTHAVDESRHALYYLRLLDIAFPGITDPAFRVKLQALSPRFGMEQDLFPVEGSPYAKVPTIDDFIQMNIAEIRTTIHHLMQRKALRKHCDDVAFGRIEPLLDALLRDELRHVGYTADLIENFARQMVTGELQKLMTRRISDFNQITHDELGNAVFDCHVECCAKRPWCRQKAQPVLPVSRDVR